MKKIICFALSVCLVFPFLMYKPMYVNAAETPGITNKAVYKLYNVGSGKYLNVHNNLDMNNTNVYQWTGDGTVEQTFKVVYDSTYGTNGGYRIYTKTSMNGRSRVLDIVKNNNQVVSGCNVQIYNPTDAIAQYFNIVSLGNNQYKIVPISNTNVALTSYGTSSGTSSTSTGNVFVSTYTGSNNQKWQFVSVSIDHETAYANMNWSYLVSPTYVSSGYANRIDPIDGVTVKFHAGIDIPASAGTTIYSANKGKVAAIINEPNTTTGRGHCLVIKSDDDNVYNTTTKIYITYMHMQSAPSYVSNASVSKGTSIIGYVGTTGASSGNHLHFGVISNGTTSANTISTTINPMFFYPNVGFTFGY